MENETNGILLLTLCMKNETVLISHEVLETLENPKHIQVLVNYEKKKLLLQSCEMTDKHAIVVPDDTMDSFLMSGPVLLKSLYRAMEWVDEGTRVVCGEPVPNRPAVLFNLDEAQPATLQSPLDVSTDC